MLTYQMETKCFFPESLFLKSVDIENGLAIFQSSTISTCRAFWMLLSFCLTFIFAFSLETNAYISFCFEHQRGHKSLCNYEQICSERFRMILKSKQKMCNKKTCNTIDENGEPFKMHIEIYSYFFRCKGSFSFIAFSCRGIHQEHPSLSVYLMKNF